MVGHDGVTDERRPVQAFDVAERRMQEQGACAVADFASATGAQLVKVVRGADTSCVNTLFGLTGSDARNVFREAQMVSVADALRADAATYAGDNRTSTAQLVLFLRAGYYVQWYHPDDVGQYGPALTQAIRPALDTFFANPRTTDVTQANGEVLAEAVTLVDSAQENARHLPLVRRLLDRYDSTYNGSPSMLAAVNNAYTILFRGHQLPEFVTAVTADRRVFDSLQGFAVRNTALLGTDKSYLVSNAGAELARFLRHDTLRADVRPRARDLLTRSTITGPTGALWVAVAAMADAYDKAECAYYDVCDLPTKLSNAILPINHTCGPTLRIRAQAMSTTELDTTCTSLRNQDAFFHNTVKDDGPVAGDLNTLLEVVVFDSARDYRTYAGPMFGIDTNNGGMYLEGDPATPGNLPRFIAHEADWLRPAFEIWNLNHEYTHYLDGRFDMHGDFTENMQTPTVWWVEGFAEYVSYHYRGVVYQNALTEAGRRTYALSTLFDTTYDHDVTRVYPWGYLAVRYLLQHHRSDVDTILRYYRAGQWQAARTYIKTIGTRYDTHWYSWLSACASGKCDTIAECTAADTRALGEDCARSNRSAALNDYDYLYLWVPAGVSTLKLTATGGTGDCDLYFNRTTWATTTAYTHRSTNTTNSESITVTAPASGYGFVSLHGKQGCTGVTVTAEY
ncbi:microbial collagenase [Saccharothrix variisporea]|uniref:microbial collagenase n=1 Tax=Saccharothrix variisporea TaxID=543527 RepID=A0A495X3T1_9PSEU|nr:microbial collagenase [Saccharothrix variisporea]